MAEDEITIRIDAHLWQRLPAANANDIVICKLCSSLVYNKEPSRDHHTRWHEKLLPGSATTEATDA